MLLGSFTLFVIRDLNPWVRNKRSVILAEGSRIAGLPTSLTAGIIKNLLKTKKESRCKVSSIRDF